MKLKTGVILAFIFAGIVHLMGCSISRVGPPGLLLASGVTPNFQNLTPLQAVERFGVPDLVIDTDERTYWVYRRSRGVFVNLIYLSWGAVERKDLQIEFQRGEFAKVHDFRSGSTGAFDIVSSGGTPGAVAE